MNLKYLDSAGDWTNPTGGATFTETEGGYSLPSPDTLPVGLPCPTVIAYMDNGSYNYATFVNEFVESNKSKVFIFNSKNPKGNVPIYSLEITRSSDRYRYAKILNSLIGMNPFQSFGFISNSDKNASLESFGYPQSDCISLYEFGDFFDTIARFCGYPDIAYSLYIDLTTTDARTSIDNGINCITALINIPNNLYEKTTVTVSDSVQDSFSFTPFFMKYLKDFDLETDEKSLRAIIDKLKSNPKSQTSHWSCGRFSGYRTDNLTSLDRFSISGNKYFRNFISTVSNIQADVTDTVIKPLEVMFSGASFIGGLKNIRSDYAGQVANFCTSDYIRCFEDISLPNVTSISFVSGYPYNLEVLRNIDLRSVRAFISSGELSDTITSSTNFGYGRMTLEGTEIENVNLSSLNVVAGTEAGNSQLDDLLSYAKYIKNLEIPTICPKRSELQYLRYVDGLTCQIATKSPTLSGGHYVCQPRLGSVNLTSVKNLKLVNTREASNTYVLGLFDNSSETNGQSSGYFKALEEVTFADGCDFANANDAQRMFRACQSLKTVDFGNNSLAMNSYSAMFQYCSSLESVSLGTLTYPESFDSSISLNSMFAYSGIRSFSDIKSVLDQLGSFKSFTVSSMFQGCENLTSTDGIEGLLNSYNNCESPSKSLESFFFGCTSLTDIDSLSTVEFSNITGLGSFLRNTAITNLDSLAEKNFGNVTSLTSTFEGCKQLTDISGLLEADFSKVTNCANLFYGCELLEDVSPLGTIDLSGVTNAQGMFGNCSSLSDVSPLATLTFSDNISGGNLARMFANTKALTDITPLDNWDTLSWFTKVGATNVSKYAFQGKDMSDATAPRWYVSS